MMMRHSRHTTLPAFVSRPDLVREHEAAMRRAGVPAHAFSDVAVGTMGQCRIICAREGTEKRWHLSISHAFRLPTWDEINAARDACIPADVWLCQPMPPREYWVNLHPHTLHIWEIRDRELIAQWAYDGCGDGERAERAAQEAMEGSR